MSTIMITGANRGIGLELTKRYAAAGNTVLACCREPSKAKELNALAAANKSVKVLGVHVADPKSVAALKATVGDQPIDVLINNAGMQGPPPQQQSLEQMDYAGWAETFAVNSMAPLRMLQTFRPNLAKSKQPKAVTITSQMGALSLDMTMAYAYCASKAAVNKVMKLASVELAQQGIAVSLIHPGWVKTDMGGPHAQLSVEESAKGIQSVIDKLTIEDTGSFKKWNGETHAW
jgi:NAD(P)-dependent dehydrogenase (short-subunit alcohol dehydrogenase family)